MVLVGEGDRASMGRVLLRKERRIQNKSELLCS